MKYFLILFFGVYALLISSCRKDDHKPAPSYNIIEFEGEFYQDPDDPLSADDIVIISVTDESPVSIDGTFKLESLENEKYQIFMANSRSSGESTYFGLSDPGSGEVLVNDSTTALGLLLINPYLLGSEQEQRKEYLYQVSKETNFPHLLSAIRQARKSNPDDPLNVDIHPEIYQLVNDIMMSAMQNLSTDEPDPKYGEELIKIIDGTGNTVGFQNFRHIFYAADISNLSNNSEKTLLLSRKEKVVGWRWKWPPWKSGPYFVEAPITNTTIEDGIFNLDFYGFNVGSFTDGDYTAIDQATLLNTVYLIFYSLDLFAGIKGEFDEKTKISGLRTLLQAEPSFLNLQYSIINGESGDLMSSLISLLVSDVGFTILSDYLRISKLKNGFLGAAAKNLNGALKVLDGLGYLNEHIPFFYDLIRGPLHKPFKYSSAGGVLTVIENNLPPEGYIFISPSVGYGVTQVSFSAAYTDDFTPKESALFSWRWEEDGSTTNEIWSAPSNNPDTVLTIDGPGTMFLRIDDLTGGEDICSKGVPYYESVEKTRIVILAGVNNYQYQYWLEDSLGYTEFGDALRYQFAYPRQSSDLLGVVFTPALLNPSTDLLVIDPSPNDYFHPEELPGNPVIECFLENKLAIMNFVRKGGNLLFISSWNSGYEGELSPYPEITEWSSHVTTTPYSNRNFINSADNTIRTGIALREIPTDYMIHLEDEFGKPLLVEAKFGQGIIINSVFNSFYDGYPPAEPIHHPVNINTFRYLIGASYK